MMVSQAITANKKTFLERFYLLNKLKVTYKPKLTSQLIHKREGESNSIRKNKKAILKVKKKLLKNKI
jgi:hypothetical protein